MLDLTFGEIIRKRRMEMKITLCGFAKMIEIHPAFLSKIESTLNYPDIGVVKKIAKSLALNEKMLLEKMEVEKMCNVFWQKKQERNKQITDWSKNRHCTIGNFQIKIKIKRPLNKL
jgi:transcriptional regulator with XRE-family HTH domain